MLIRSLPLWLRQAPGLGSERHVVEALMLVPASGTRSALVAIASMVSVAVDQLQITAELLDHHLGGVLVLAALVGPFADAQHALDEHPASLGQILFRHIPNALVEDDDPASLSALTPLTAGLVVPAVAGRQGEADDLRAALRVADIRILAQDDLVDATGHDRILSCIPKAFGRCRPVPSV